MIKRLILWLCLLWPCATPVWADITGPAIRWDMDEGSGPTIADTSGNNRTGTLGTSTKAPTWLSGASCKAGSCLQFNGTGANVTFSYILPSTWSWVGWIWSDAAANLGYANIFIETANRGIYLWQQSGANEGKINLFGSADHLSTSGIPNDTWTHVGVTVNAGSYIIYINGVNSGSGTGGPTGITINTMGADAASGQDFGGRLDSVWVFGRELSSGDVNEHMTTTAGSAATVVKRRAIQY